MSSTLNGQVLSEKLGGHVLVDSLRAHGVEMVFGVPGESYLAVLDGLQDANSIQTIICRQEGGATMMAEAYGKMTGKPGVCLVTRGPGATNAVTGLTDALMDSVPLLCLTGQVPTHLIGTDAFQEADTIGITSSCTKHNYLVKDIKDLENTIAEGFYVARSGRPGPVVIDLPKDVQNSITNYKGLKIKSMTSYKPAKKAKLNNIKEAIDLSLIHI